MRGILLRLQHPAKLLSLAIFHPAINHIGQHL
jgi:hypothetical protein